MDEQLFASLAQISILIIPVGNIDPQTFEKWAVEVRKFEEIRLGDIPSRSKDERARFMPNPLSNGFLNLSYVSRPQPQAHSQMTLFRPSSFPLGVVGISSCSKPAELQVAQAHFKASISTLCPPGTLYPLARSCFVFEDGRANTNLDAGKSLPELYIIPSMMGNKQIYIGTLLAELCSTILGEFSTITQMLETPIGNEALNATLFGELPGASDPSSPTDIPDIRPTSQPALPTQKVHGDTSSSSFSREAPPTILKRSSTLGPGTMPSRNSTLLPAGTRKRASAAASSASAARLYKVLGDLFLLSGRTMDATIWFTEAIVLLKQSQDFLWHASALEGIATALVIDALTTNHSEGTQKEPWHEIAEKMTQAVNLYQKLAMVYGDEDTNGNIAQVYVSSAIRHSLLLFCIWASGGWGPQAFSAMLHPSSFQRLITSTDVGHSTGQKVARLTSASRVTREMISSVIAPAHGPWILHLGSRNRVEALRTMAKLYATMGFRRKESYVLRELIGCVMDILAVGREERPPQLTPSLESLRDGLQVETQGGDIGLRESEDTTGNDSVVRLIKRTCEVLGVDFDIVKFVQGDDETPEPLLPTSFTQPFNDSNSLYGWPPLQIAVVQEMLYVVEALPDYPAVVTFGLSALRSLRAYLDGDAQYRLFTTTARATSTARRRGVPLELEFWPGNLLTGISLTPLHFTRAPIDIKLSSIRRIAPKSVDGALVVDPFLYNPRRISTEKQRSLIVQDEEVEFMVELFNPYFVTLELQHVSLSTSGAEFESTPAQVFLPANSSQSIALKGKAKQEGHLVIRGCFLQLPGTARREAVLPLLNEDEKVKQLRRISAITDSRERLKHKGLTAWMQRDHRSSQLRESLLNLPQLRFAELTVVPKQPLLRIRRTSLTHGAVMLYEGETVIIRLTLENVSSINVNLLHLNVGDSTKDLASSALTEGGLSPLEVYETEHELVHRPVLSLDTDLNGKEIGPGEEAVIALRCFGKAGCISGTLQFHYGNSPNADTDADTLYGRQLVFPVLITVYQILECHSLDICPLASMDRSYNSPNMETKQWHSVFKSVNTREWSLLSIQVTNNYNLPFEVTLFYHTKSDDLCNTQLIPPGSTYRLIIPVRRFHLPQSESTAPIPSLTNRQFVLNEPSAANDSLQRELFWYREHLLQEVRLEWKESGGSRCGELSLRRQQITYSMLQSLRTDAIQITLDMVGDESEEDVVIKRMGSFGNCYEVSSNRMVVLRASLKNVTESPQIISLSLTVEPSEHVLYDGVLAGNPLGRLESQETSVFEIGVALIAEGQFQIQAQAFTSGVVSRAGASGTGELIVNSVGDYFDGAAKQNGIIL